MQLSPAEAEQALRAIQTSRLAFRRAIRASKGYQHLWLWGAVWVVLAMLGQFGGPNRQWAGTARSAVLLIGFVGSLVIGWNQRRHVRMEVDRRFLGALAA